jgi:hypothetical protein
MASWTTGHPHSDAETVPKRACALLWDESFLWGVMAWRALKAAGLPFDLLRSEDIRQGALYRYRMIFVPGGWASNKISALGERGREEIRHPSDHAPVQRVRGEVSRVKDVITA